MHDLPPPVPYRHGDGHDEDPSVDQAAIPTNRGCYPHGSLCISHGVGHCIREARRVKIPFQPLLLLLATVSSLWGPIIDIDTWTHIKSGEVIWQAGCVPTGDLFSYTAFGKEWINHQWGGDLLLYALYTPWGMWGLLGGRWVVGCLIAAAIFATGSWLSQSRWLSLFCTILAMPIIGLRIMGRPAMFSTLLLCGTVWLVTAVRTGRWSARAYWWLPPLFFGWANLHGGVLIGLVVLAFFWGEDCVRQRHDPGHRPWYLRRGVCFLACCLVTLINPFGYRILTFPLENLRHTVGIQQTLEWYSAFHPEVANLADARWIPYLFLVVGAGLLFQRGAMGIAYLLLLGLTALMAMKAARFVAEFAAVVAPLLAQLVTNVTTRCRKVTTFVAIVGSLLLTGVLAWNALQRGSIAHQHAQVLATEWPDFTPDLMAFLNHHAITGRVFNDLNLGSNFIFFRGPKEKVFFDGRHSIYGNHFYQEYLAALQQPTAFEALSQRYGPFDYIVLGQLGWEQHVNLHRYLWMRDEWELVFASQKGYIYVRRIPQFADLIRQFRFTDPPAFLRAHLPFLPSKSRPLPIQTMR